MTENIETHQSRIQLIRDILVGALGPFEMMADIIVGSQHGPYGSRLFGIVQSPVTPDVRPSSRSSGLYPGTTTSSSSPPNSLLQTSKGSSTKKSYREKESLETSSPSTSSEANSITEKKRRASSRKDDDDYRKRRKRRKSDSFSKNDEEKDSSDWQKPCSSGLGNKIDSEDNRITMNDLFGEENKFARRDGKINDKPTKVRPGDDRKKEEGESPDSGFVDEPMDSDRERQTQHLEMENILEELGHVSPLLSPVRKPSRLPPLVRNGSQRSLKCELNLSLIEAPERERLLNKLYSMEHAVELIPGPQLSPPPRPSSRFSRSPCIKTSSSYISSHTSPNSFIKESNENSLPLNSQTKNRKEVYHSKKKLGRSSPNLRKEVLKKETVESPRCADTSSRHVESNVKEEPKIKNVSPTSSTSSASVVFNDSLKDQENDNLTASHMSPRLKKDEDLKRKIKRGRTIENDRKESEISERKRPRVNKEFERKNESSKLSDSKRDDNERLKDEKERVKNKDDSRNDEKRKEKYKDSARFREDSRLKEEREEEQIRDDAHIMREDNDRERRDEREKERQRDEKEKDRQREEKERERFRDDKERERPRDEKERQRRENDDEGRNRLSKDKQRDTKIADSGKLRVDKDVAKLRREKDGHRLDEKADVKRKDKLKSERKELRDKERIKSNTTFRSKEISGTVGTSSQLQSKSKPDEKERAASNSSKGSKKEREGFICCADKVEKKKKELEFEEDHSLKPAAFYESKSRPKKHKADEEKDKVLKVLYYFDSIVYFMLTAAVNSRNRNASCQIRQFNHLRDIAELLKTATNRFVQSTDHTPLMSHYIARVKILSLRAQAVLNFQLFSLKTREIYKNANTLAKFETKYRELEASSRRFEQTPPTNGSQNVQPVNGQSAQAVGSQSVHSAATPSPASSSHSAGSERAREITLPLDLFKTQKAQLSHLNHLLWAHLTWDDANAIRGQRDRDLVEKLDEVCGSLTIESSLESLSLHLATGVSWLIAEYELEAGFNNRV